MFFSSGIAGLTRRAAAVPGKGSANVGEGPMLRSVCGDRKQRGCLLHHVAIWKQYRMKLLLSRWAATLLWTAAVAAASAAWGYPHPNCSQS